MEIGITSTIVSAISPHSPGRGMVQPLKLTAGDVAPFGDQVEILSLSHTAVEPGTYVSYAPVDGLMVLTGRSGVLA